MAGKMYGVGIGPGDPELLTLKALRIIRESDVIALPGKVAEETVAYKIVIQAYPQLAQKELLTLHMPMSKVAQELETSHDVAADQIKQALDAGKQVAFLTLGDATVYSTYLYVHKRLQAQGYEIEIISGIPSFCAVAARLNMGLVEKSQQLHIIPASYQIQDALQLSGTKVLMKAGTKMAEVKEQVRAQQQLGRQPADVIMIENCGMPEEKIYQGVDEIPASAGYYSLIIIKENEQEEQQ